MGESDALTQGMSLEDAKRALRGWRVGLPSAILSMDKTHLFTTFDFDPPSAAVGSPMRLTFDNGRLLFWGTPKSDDGSDPVPHSAS